MLVDDDCDAVFTFKFVLESYDYEVDGFTDPILALKRFSRGLYDLIVIDIRMPTMNGFELYKLLKRRDYEANICFVTAGEIQWQDCHDIQYAIDSKRFLRKPISNSELLDYAASNDKIPSRNDRFMRELTVAIKPGLLYQPYKTIRFYVTVFRPNIHVNCQNRDQLCDSFLRYSFSRLASSSAGTSSTCVAINQ